MRSGVREVPGNLESQGRIQLHTQDPKSGATLLRLAVCRLHFGASSFFIPNAVIKSEMKMIFASQVNYLKLDKNEMKAFDDPSLSVNW